MRDFVRKVMETKENETGMYELFGFAVADYMYMVRGAVSDDKIPETIDVAGIILEPSDSESSIRDFIGMICNSSVDLFVLGFINDESEKYDPNISTWISEAFGNSANHIEVPVYEDRVVYALKPECCAAKYNEGSFVTENDETCKE